MNNLAEKIKNCLSYAVYGAEITKMDPWGELFEKANLTPLIEIMAAAYIKKQGRITAEDFAELLRDNEALPAKKAFWFMDLYSAMERLREGMHPRLNGIGACPDGNISAAMSIVGIYHAGDSEYAYIDGIEMASVIQRAPAVEWAALAAASVAEALTESCTAASLIERIMKLAHSQCTDVYYEINALLHNARQFDDEGFIDFYKLTCVSQRQPYHGYNPISRAFLLLDRFGDDPQKIMSVALTSNFSEIYAPVIYAIVGALYPADELAAINEPIEPIVDTMLPLVDIVLNKLEKDKQTARIIEKTASEIDANGESLLYKKVLGCILAGAIGNAFGSPLENLQYYQVDERYPGGVTTILDPSKLETEDDNQIAMMLYEAYIKRNGLPATAKDYGAKWVEMMDRDMYFNCIRSTYDLLRDGMDPRICGHWNYVTGSSVMCMEPVGVYHMGDVNNAFLDGISMSYLNQRGLDVTAAAIVAAATAKAMEFDATVEGVIQAALDVAPKEKMLTFDKRKIDTPYDFIAHCVDIASKYDDVMEARKELHEKCTYYHPIDPLELLGLSFAMLAISKGDMRMATIGGANIGRDADTIAGRAAMLAGTINGYENIPKEWIDMINPDSLERIKTNARKIADLISINKLDLMKKRLALY